MTYEPPVRVCEDCDRSGPVRSQSTRTDTNLRWVCFDRSVTCRRARDQQRARDNSSRARQRRRENSAA